MREKGRFNRYVSTAKSDGLFRVEPWFFETRTRGDEMQAQLAPCRNCLSALNFENFGAISQKEKSDIVDNFDIEAFFDNYKPIFRCLPLYTSENFPEGNYTSNWARISEDVRRLAQWKCRCCGVDLKDSRGLLHVHHKDGNRGNNRPSNLMPLCLECHKRQPFHEGMFASDVDIKKLENCRIDQGLSKGCPKCGDYPRRPVL